MNRLVITLLVGGTIFVGVNSLRPLAQTGIGNVDVMSQDPTPTPSPSPTATPSPSPSPSPGVTPTPYEPEPTVTPTPSQIFKR